MENQNQNNIDQNQNNALRAYVAAKRGKQKRRMIGLLAVLFTIGLGYFGISNPQLFRGDITEIDVPNGSNALYIPNYQVTAGDMGFIAVKSREDIGKVHSVTFKLKYNPVNALAFTEDSIVFDQESQFQSADLKSVNATIPGEIRASFFSSQAVNIAAGPLFKLSTTINPDLAEGTSIQLSATDVDVIIPDSVSIYKSSTVLTGIDTGSVVLASQNNLRLLSAEIISNHEVLLHFSDLIAATGESGDYQITYAVDQTPISILEVKRGDERGYGQNTVYLKTEPTAAIGAYHLQIREGGALKSNAQGGIHGEYNASLFVASPSGGFGISDFHMESARAVGNKRVEITFSAPIAAPSVAAADFTIKQFPPAGGLGDSIAITDVSVSGDTLFLDTQQNLATNVSYVVEVPDKEAPDAPQRETDGAKLGINKAAFIGSESRPRVISAGFTDETTIEIMFDRTVTTQESALGNLRPAFSSDSFFTIDPNDPNVTFSDNKIIIKNVDFNNPKSTFIYVANGLIIANNASLDPAYNSVSFYGFGHDAGLHTVGSLTVLQPNALQIQPGTLNFNTVSTNNTLLYYYTDPGDGAIVSVGIDSIDVVEGHLKIKTSTDLTPEHHYFLHLGDPVDSIDQVLNIVEFVVESDFAVTTAKAVSPTEAIVTFSDNVNQGTVNPGAFSIDPDVQVSEAEVLPNFKEVKLKMAGTLEATRVYMVSAQGITSFFGGEPLTLNSAPFVGYQTQTQFSNVSVQSVTSLSPTSVQVQFSSVVDESTVTPVNMTIVSAKSLATGKTLTIKSVKAVDDSTFILETAMQESDTNYLFLPGDMTLSNGVKDLRGLLVQKKHLLNFPGFTIPPIKVGTVTPNAVTNNTDHIIVLTGKNLHTVASVRLGDTDGLLAEQPESGNSLGFTVPAGFAADSYNITLVSHTGATLTLNNALTVSAPDLPMRVISAESKATPFKVPNDGETEVTLWVLVEDPKGIDNVDRVVINLEAIDGDRAQEMKRNEANKSQFRQWFTFKTVIPATVATSQESIQLPVEARKNDEIATGFAGIHVSADVFKSVAPTIDQAFFLPVSVPPDGKTPVKIGAKVTDPDGAESITSVIVNLGSLGVGFVPLREVNGAQIAGENVSRFFQSDEFTVPNTTPEANYQVTITAQDTTGEVGEGSLTLNVSSEQSGPSFDVSQSYVAPTKSIVHDGKTPFSINTFVKDSDGIGDIETVIANFGTLGIKPAALIKNVDVSDEARGTWFSVEGLTIPSTAPLGGHEIIVVATDKAGASAQLRLQIDVTDRDVYGEPPHIFTKRAYTTPAVLVNDGETAFTLHVFVGDDDDDIESVLVNLSTIGQVGSQSAGDFTEVGKGNNDDVSDSVSCPENSNTLLCMKPSIKEGADGQWFVLSGITIRRDIVPSSKPYNVEVIAVDASGKTSKQNIPLYVNDGKKLTNDAAPPTILGALATGATSVEVVFSEELDANTVSPFGHEFSIVKSNDVSAVLNIISVTIDASGSVVTLETENQTQGQEYTLSATNDIRDAVGVPLSAGSGSRATFRAYEFSEKPPVVDYAAATSPTTVEVEFRDRDALLPSSVTLADFKVHGESADGKQLNVTGVRFTESTKVLELTTSTQKPNERYRINISGISNVSGIEIPRAINQIFKGYKGGIHDAGTAGTSGGYIRTADLNGDGKVDFIDFTMFSAVYGTLLQGGPGAPDSSAGNAGQPGFGQPIPNNPDATIPVTQPVSTN